MNEPGVTESAPGFGSVDSPVVIVGQSLCHDCMEKQEPFYGNSGLYLDKALEIADIDKTDIFITNAVHCHPPNDRPSKRHEIDNCRHFLREELQIVQPRLVIGLGKDAKAELIKYYPKAQKLSWPFRKPRSYKPDVTYLLFPPHPGSLRWLPTDSRQYYAPSLARALRWSFDACD